MTDLEKKIYALDAAYKPFPTFAEWASRTSVDTVRWDRYKAELENGQGVSDEALRRAREVVKRAAALDTGAIEGLYEVDRGFTFTVAFETAAWEYQLAQKGEKVRSLFEAQMHAYDYVLDLATMAEPISEAAIRVLHEVVCRAQDTYRVMTAIGPQEQELVKGRYKVLPNHVRTRDGLDHSYAPVDVTPAEMKRLVEEMRSEAFLAAHPATQAAYTHYGLVVIHPFPDGNGRLARALASAFTYRAIAMPIMILSEQKNAYLDSLEAADIGEYQSFVDFMLARSLDTLKLVNESFLGALSPTVDEGLAAINRLFVTRGGYSQNEVDNAGNQLMKMVTNELTRVLAGKTGTNLTGRVGPFGVSGREIDREQAYRLPADAHRELTFLHVELSTSSPASARVYRDFALWLPIDAAGDDDIHIVRIFDENPQTMEIRVGTTRIGSPMRAEKVFSARMDELVPTISGVLQISVGLFSERVVGEMLAELTPLAKKALHGQT